MHSVWAMVVASVLNGTPANPYTTLFDERSSCETEAGRINDLPPEVFRNQTGGVLGWRDTIAVCIEVFPEMLSD